RRLFDWSDSMRPQRVDQCPERRERRSVRFAIDPPGPEMALEGGDRVPGPEVVDAADLHVVAVKRQHRLRRPHRRTFLLMAEQRGAGERRGLGPVPDPGARELVPGEDLARIAFARR